MRLLECAHWCVAGTERRKQEDYGYWYAPDGRTEEQQAVFEKVEVKPQAIERILSSACGQPFRISADNIRLGNKYSEAFADDIHQQTLTYCEQGLPQRANELAHALAEAFKQTNPLDSASYPREDLK